MPDTQPPAPEPPEPDPERVVSGTGREWKEGQVQPGRAPMDWPTHDDGEESPE